MNNKIFAWMVSLGLFIAIYLISLVIFTDFFWSRTNYQILLPIALYQIVMLALWIMYFLINYFWVRRWIQSRLLISMSILLPILSVTSILIGVLLIFWNIITKAIEVIEACTSLIVVMKSIIKLSYENRLFLGKLSLRYPEQYQEPKAKGCNR